MSLNPAGYLFVLVHRSIARPRFSRRCKLAAASLRNADLD